jgi:hypothetical protein
LLTEVKKGRKEKIGSLVDPAPMHRGRVHLACDEAGFVKNLEVVSGEKNEGSRLEGMIEKERKAQRIEGVCADALYDSARNRRYLKELGIKAYIPPRKEQSAIERFEIEGERVRCRAGKCSIGKIEQENGFLRYFSVKDCRGCENYKSCVSPNEIRKKVYLSDCKALRDEIYKERMGVRKLIERLFGWAKRWLGLRRVRYGGIGKVSIQAILTFLAIDLKPVLATGQGQ